MDIEDNDSGGTSVILAVDDDLGEVPESHRKLITPQLCEAFVDPTAWFRRIADRSPFPAMSSWIRALVADGLCEMAIHRCDAPNPDDWTAAGIRWWSTRVMSAEITPASGLVSPELPPALRRYYSLVGEVRWMPFGCSGGLAGDRGHEPLTNFFDRSYGAEIDPNRTYVMGWSPGGDMLIYTWDGRGGWICHGEGKIHLLGSIEDTIEWVYTELLANRCPEFDYTRWI